MVLRACLVGLVIFIYSASDQLQNLAAYVMVGYIAARIIFHLFWGLALALSSNARESFCFCSSIDF